MSMICCLVNLFSNDTFIRCQDRYTHNTVYNTHTQKTLWQLVNDCFLMELHGEERDKETEIYRGSKSRTANRRSGTVNGHTHLNDHLKPNKVKHTRSIYTYPMLILTWMPMIQNSDEFFSSFSSFSLYAQVFNNAMSLSIISISLEMKASTDWIDFNNFHLRFFFFYLGNIHLNNVGDGFFFQTNAISEWISERNAWWNGNN